MSNLKKIVGRTHELELLKEIQAKNNSSLVVIKGRRRIGKSFLARNFALKYGSHFFEFSGLAPQAKMSNGDQLNEFLRQLKKQLPCRRDKFESWGDAFDELGLLIKKKKGVVVLLDEISWMGHYDENFPGYLKLFWDLHFSNLNKSQLICCGSFSTWIQKNILNSTNFVGRVSLDLQLQELPLSSVDHFWGHANKNISSIEKMRLLAVTGLVPKYLEEINYKKTALENINHLCFHKSGFLYDEFNRIFTDIFEKKAETYKKILLCLTHQNLSAQQIANKLKMQLSTSLLDYLQHLEISGFISRDYYFGIGQKTARDSRYRIKDNYMRFALKYIEPEKNRKSGFNHQIATFENLKNWKSVLGFQFENLIFNHLSEIIQGLKLNPSQIMSASPYKQVAKTRNKGGCQIDLMIQTEEMTAYVCEIKLQNIIDKSIINDVQKKIVILEKKRNWSYRPVLIYEGDLHPNDHDEISEYFSKTIRLSDLMTPQ